jgi:hypothetical protein
MSFISTPTPVAALQNGLLPRQVGRGNGIDPTVERIEQALKAQLSVDELSGAEQEAYFDKLEEAMWTPTQDERVAFTAVVMNPGAVGLDENDRIVAIPTSLL